MQLACQWNLAQPAVECVVPTLIQEAGEGAAPIEDKRAELAALPVEQRLSGADVAEIRAIGDNTGSMALKGANPAHEGEERPDRWPLSAELDRGRQALGRRPRARPGRRRSLPRMERKWWTLAGTCAGLFLLMLDSTVVALALPSIRHDVGATAAGLQWVMNGYLLAITVFVVTAGRLGDMFGRKRLFMPAPSSSPLGSVVSGAAGDELTLIAGRVLQGIGAAPMLPLSLAIVCNAFPADEQARALGVWAGISAVALAIGPFVGGALVELDWRVIFWINLPVAAIAIAITALAAPESTDPGSGRRLDFPGLLTLSFGLTAVVLALVQAQAWSTGLDLRARRSLGVAALYAFWRIEHRSAEPIVDFALFRNRPLLRRQRRRLRPGRRLLERDVLPVAVPAGRARPLGGPQRPADPADHDPDGLHLADVEPPDLPLRHPAPDDRGDAVRGGRPDRPHPDRRRELLRALLAGYLPFGVALGLVYAPMSTAAMAAMPPDKVGIASGVLAMDRVMAGTIALAATGAISHALIESGDGFAAAIAGSTWFLVALCAAGAWLTWTFVRDAEPRHPDPHHRRFHL